MLLKVSICLDTDTSGVNQWDQTIKSVPMVFCEVIPVFRAKLIKP